MTKKKARLFGVRGEMNKGDSKEEYGAIRIYGSLSAGSYVYVCLESRVHIIYYCSLCRMSYPDMIEADAMSKIFSFAS